MNRLCCWLVRGLIVAVMGAVGCHDGTTKPASAIPTKHTAVGFSASTDHFAVSAGHLVDHPGKPGVTFGTLSIDPKKSTQLTYVILFRLPPRSEESSFRVDGYAQSLSGGGEEVKSHFQINGKRIEASASYKLNSDRTAVVKETLTIGGKDVDPAGGRLFLLDLTKADPAYQQKKIDLPDDVPKLETTEDVERYAELLLKHLQEKAPELKDWVK